MRLLGALILFLLLTAPAAADPPPPEDDSAQVARIEDGLEYAGRCHAAAHKNTAVADAPRAVRTACRLAHLTSSARDLGPAASSGVPMSTLLVGRMAMSVNGQLAMRMSAPMSSRCRECM